MAEAIVTDPTVTGNAPVLPPFVFEGHNIRTVKDDFFPWFVAKDVCAALGLTWSGNTLRSVPEDWKRVGKLPARTPGVSQNDIPKTCGSESPHPKKGGLRGAISLISEPAVYKLAFRSNKPEADRFTNWIASEVIPAIRRTGQYQVAQAALPTGPLAPAQQQELQNIVAAKSSAFPKEAIGRIRAQIWSRVHNRFKVAKYDQIPAGQFPEAVEYIVAMTVKNALAIEGEPQKALPPGSDTVTLRDYARFYGNLPETDEAWNKLEHRACVAYEAFRDEVLAIHKAAYAPFHERRASNVGNFFDEVIKPSREMMRTAGDNAHLALRALADGIHGMAAAWRLLVKG